MRAAVGLRDYRLRAWFVGLLALLAAAIASPARAQTGMETGMDSSTKTSGGMTVYIGLIPAVMLKDHAPTHTEQQMHGGVPKGSHQTHLVVAVFDATTGDRITDAIVRARISPLGLVGAQKLLEPMRIAETTTYGQFFDFPGADKYTVTIDVQRTKDSAPVRFDFTFAHIYGTEP